MIAIRGGLVADGSGGEPFAADVLVEGDRIAGVVPAAEAPAAGYGAAAVLDARGCVVSPGFIDSHAHSDAYLVLEPSAPSKIMQGVTTEVNGQ